MFREQEVKIFATDQTFFGRISLSLFLVHMN